MVRFHGLVSWACYLTAIVGGTWLFVGFFKWWVVTAVIGVLVGFVLDVIVSLLEFKYRRLFPDTEPRGRSFWLYGVATLLALVVLVFSKEDGSSIISAAFAVATVVDLVWALFQKLSSPPKGSTATSARVQPPPPHHR